MTVPTTSWDENSPAGSQEINLGDNRIRELKTQLREVIGVDHDFPSSGQAADVGQHLQVTLQEQADLGTGAVNATILGSQTVSGKGELVYTDEDDNDVQLTNGGKLLVPISTYTAKSSLVSADSLLISDSAASEANKKVLISTLLSAIYPVGVIVTLGVSTNPATLFGIGTWTAIEGYVIAGKASTGTFDTLDETMGAETHTLTVDEMPAHTHDYTRTNTAASSGASAGGDGDQTLTTQATTSAGGGSAHNNIQPTIVKYIWQRTA